LDKKNRGYMKKEDIINIIKDALKVDKITIESSVDNLEEWDSLGHLSILVALDKEFDGRLASISDLATADSVEKIISILENKNFI
jgi:acyl carrier protein